MKKMPKRYPHSLSNRFDCTLDMGYVYPVNWEPVLPGDTFQCSTIAQIKCNQLLAQIQSPCQVTISHAYIPDRLNWDDCQEFHTGGEDGMSVFDHPVIRPSVVAESSLLDYLGFSPGNYGTREFNALPVRAYSLFINHFYHDQDLMTERVIDTTSGLDTTTDLTLAPALWQKDYFSASRPFTQRGDDLTIPVSNAEDSLPILGIGKYNNTFGQSSATARETFGTAPDTYANASYISNDTSVGQTFYVEEDPNNSGYPYIRAELADNLGLNIDDFRLSIAMQRMYERMGRNGYRYSDYLRSMGLPSSDARLNQPELLGLGKNIITFSEVLSTDGANTGDEYGYGKAVMRTNRYRRYFEEHGIMMTFISVMPKPQYDQIISRHLLKQTKEDYFIKELQHIGEQTITNQEAYAFHSSPENAWGYLPRYEEYRGSHSRIAGELHTTQNHRHMARIYSGDIALNSSWLTTEPTKRVFGAPGTESLNLTALNSVRARRIVSPLGRAKII